MERNTVQQQSDVLEKLKNASHYQLPNIPFFDFKAILQKVRREKKKEIYIRKWNKFLKNEKIYKDLTNAQAEFPFHNDKPKKYNFYRNLDSISQFSFCSIKEFPYSELYSVYKRVQRQRKKIRDEEKWQCFINKEVISPREREPTKHETQPGEERSECGEERTGLRCCNDCSAGSDFPQRLEGEEEEEALISQISSLDQEPSETDLVKINSLYEEISVIFKSIVNLLRRPPENGNVAPGARRDESKQSAFEFNEILRTYFMEAINRQMKKLINHTGNPLINTQITYLFHETFDTLLHATQAVEKQLLEHDCLDGIRENISGFLNLAFSVFSIYWHVFSDTGTKIFCEKIQDIESGILEALHILKSCSHGKSPFTESQMSKEEVDGMEPAKSWLKESIPLARIKFGPPNQIRGQIPPATYGENTTSHNKGETLIIQEDNLRDLMEESLKRHRKSMTARSNEEKNLNPTQTTVNGVKNSLLARIEIEKNNGLMNDGDKSNSISRNSIEESLPKIIARKIHEIPGVDGELGKVEEIRIKMMSVLLNIRNAITRSQDLPVLPLDDEYERTLQRTVEFGARFKRNYSYRTKCQINELKTLDSNPLLIKKKSKVIVVIQKLLTAHQGVLQALQVIEKQLQTIAVVGLTQEVFFMFYHYIYELTFLLKPFYGFTKTQVLDDVEKLALESIKLLKELKHEQEMAKYKSPKSNANKQKAKAKMLKEVKMKKDKLSRKKSPYANKLIKKVSRHSVEKHPAGEKPGGAVEEKPQVQQEEKPGLNFLMEIKQRRGLGQTGAGLGSRHRWRGQPLAFEPQTMVQLLGEEPQMPSNIALSTSEEMVADTLKYQSVFNLQDQPTLFLKKNPPQNVKLITMKHEESEIPVQNRKNNNNCGRNDPGIWDDMIKYKEEFQIFKKSNPLYNKKSLQTVKTMTEKLMDEALSDSLTKVLNTINIQDITTLNSIQNILEEEIK